MAALQLFFDGIPERTGAAFVVVVHLDPERRSELPQILAGRTRMPVTQVNATEKLEEDRVDVIPPDRRIQLIDHIISAAEFDEPRGKRAPIDLFFRSAAERVGDGFAVVLSGAGSDGAIGVRAVKEAGGIILVQDPQEAEYSSMPRSAIASGVADFILPVRDLAARLVELIRIKGSVKEAVEPEVDEELLRRVLAHLRVRTGHDFSKYKRSTVLRRIARRMQVTRTDDLRQYYEVMRESADEAHALLGDLLISVTTFFRDHDAFEALSTNVLPSLFEDRDLNATIRVWVSGCATGEEAYSIAMLLLEEAAKHEFHPPIQMFGSDLDARALAVAREGRYPSSIEADVSEERLRRFFIREGEGYRVRQDLRDVVLFALHDLLKDPPFSHVDPISCRNVLIYLDRDLQDQVCSTFHYALNPKGFLLLGASESADSPPGLFRGIDRNARIYKAIDQNGEKARLLPRLLGPITIRDQTVFAPRHVSPSVALSEAALHRRVLEKVAPPSILVDDVDLAELVHKLLEPYAPEGSVRYRIEAAERFAVPADLATSFALVLHELATNAAKYGSFSQAGGVVVVKWSVKSRQGERILEFIWEERGGPPAQEPQQPGKGSALIETRSLTRPSGGNFVLKVSYAPFRSPCESPSSSQILGRQIIGNIVVARSQPCPPVADAGSIPRRTPPYLGAARCSTCRCARRPVQSLASSSPR